MKLQLFIVVVTFVALGSADNLPGVPIRFTGNNQVVSAISADIAQQFANEYIKYLRTGVETIALRQIFEKLAASHTEKDILTKNIGDLSLRDQFFLCTTCRATVNVFTSEYFDPNGELNGEVGRARLKIFAIELCSRLQFGSKAVCGEIFELYFPFLEYIMENTSADSRTACGALPFSICSIDQPEYNWNLNINANGPPLTGSKSDFPGKSANDLHILHLTDIHYDPDYIPGSLAVCPNALCCRTGDSNSVETHKQAGYWGDYRDCDSPLHTIEYTFAHIANTHPQIDYIYHTGDIVPHNFWETTKEGNLELISEINGLLETSFPNLKVYPCVGNHEAHPANIFGSVDMPGEMGVGWLFEALWAAWSRWLPESAKATVLDGGYYTVSPRNGFRIISLNNNYGYLFNFFLLYDGGMPLKQLQWLHDTLLAAETAGEYVHILMHIPSADADSYTVWAREFNRIIERFNHIIGGIFTGHTHKDELNVHYNARGYAIANTFNGGSLTAYSYSNPNYKMYEVDPKTLQVVDYHTWIFNLTEANLYGIEKHPAWHRSYSFSEEFTQDLSPAGLGKLLDKMAEHPELVHKFWAHKWTKGDIKLEQGCNNKCLLYTICRMATSVYDQKEPCRELQAKLREHLPNAETTTTSTSSPSSTDRPTTGSTTTEDPGNGGGVTVISALQLTVIMGLLSFGRLVM